MHLPLSPTSSCVCKLGAWVVVDTPNSRICLNFDPMCDRPHGVGANQEELVVVDLIAQGEGVEPQPRK